MSNLQLEEQDVALLADVIRSYLNDLHDEITHTDDYDLRQALHQKQQRLQEIVQQLGGAAS
ncbi:MAG TPA: hypothetical protein VFJ16_02265 [Longimicrobium sp.]|nr:hypothetical protein [Longimicrobium sp.]